MTFGRNVRYVLMDILSPNVSLPVFLIRKPELEMKFISLSWHKFQLKGSFLYFVKNYQISRSNSLMDNFQVFWICYLPYAWIILDLSACRSLSLYIKLWYM